MDEKKLKLVLNELKKKYEGDWGKVERDIMQTFEEIREIIENNEIDFETAETIYEKVKKVNNLARAPNKHFVVLWIWPSDRGFGRNRKEYVNKIKFRVLNDQECRETLIEAKNLSDLNGFKVQMEEALRNAIGVKVATYSSWLCIFNPELFMPIHGYSINAQFRKDFKLTKFWETGRLEDRIEKFVNFTKIVKKVADELEIGSMIEVAFYLCRYESPSN